jgi:hypothetical protein
MGCDEQHQRMEYIHEYPEIHWGDGWQVEFLTIAAPLG